MKMLCRDCGEPCTVVDCVGNAEYVYRRRKCKSCGYVMYTEEYEMIDPEPYYTACYSHRYKKAKTSDPVDDDTNVQMSIPVDDYLT